MHTAIVILNWNGKAFLEAFLSPLLDSIASSDAQVIVADNGSTDGSVAFLQEVYPQLRLILFDRNHGFTGGYNKALQQIEAKYYVLLNSDIKVDPHWLKPLVDFMDSNPQAGVCMPKIRSFKQPDFFEYAGACGGFIDRYGYPFCRGRILSHIEKDTGQYDTPVEIFWASGACLFIRLHDFKEAGGLDSQFFAHQEEIDLCWRLNARGKRIVCLPQSVIYHVGAATLKKTNPQKEYLNFRNNLLMLYKNLPNPYYSRIMRIRVFLDYLSATHCLMRGQWANAWAIYKARRDFHRMKAQYDAVRHENLEKSMVEIPDTLLPISLIWEYYVKGKMKFSQYGKGNIC